VEPETEETFAPLRGESGEPAPASDRFSEPGALDDDIVRKRSSARMSLPAKKLRALQTRYPYLALPVHHLHRFVVETEELIDNGDESRAEDHLHRIEQEVEQEESTLAAAFSLFKPPDKDCLAEGEVQVMLKYLGFPNTPKDVEDVIKAVDKDGDRLVDLGEFQGYVGKMGGTVKLFEMRRQQTKDKDHGGGAKDYKDYRDDLVEAGITDQAQAYWRVVIPVSEFGAAAAMVECQKNAIRHIRTLAKSNHDARLPTLQARVKALGFSDNDLWMTLMWIRELAPILVHLNLDKMMQYLETDTHYRNQFETATSGGLLKPAVREKWERDLFGGNYDKARGVHRCKYGVLNAMNDYRGVVRCAQYGDSYLVLKNVRLRCTFSPENSANLKAERLAVLDYYAHVLDEYKDAELKETIKVAKSTEAAILGDSEKVGAMKYKEAQLHGPVCFATDVERLVATVRHRGKDTRRIENICKKHGWKFSWMDEERKRMEKEEKSKLGEGAWKERLQAIMDKVPDAKDVPPGYCRKGCGRPVHPGERSGGKKWTTCCRGCAMGFGHDMNCGNIDPKLVGPGMCMNGCGREVNPGTTDTGRKFLTCCRSCNKGFHDKWCGAKEEDVSNIEVGMCKMGCGRKVAESKDGKRKFDTCCRGCATGKEHTKWCKP